MGGMEPTVMLCKWLWIIPRSSKSCLLVNNNNYEDCLKSLSDNLWKMEQLQIVSDCILAIMASSMPRGVTHIWLTVGWAAATAQSLAISWWSRIPNLCQVSPCMVKGTKLSNPQSKIKGKLLITVVKTKLKVKFWKVKTLNL